MPPQKNSGNRGAKRNSPVDAKNNRFISAYMSDVKAGGDATEGVYVARILNKYGSGRMGVFYMDEENRPKLVQAIIRGSFRGKGKRDVWIDVGSIVIVATSGIGGSREYEIMSVLSDEDVKQLRKEVELDGRLFDINNVDTERLLGEGLPPPADIIFEEEVNVDDI